MSRAEEAPPPSTGVLRARFPAECDDELDKFEEAAAAMSRRMDVMLLTVRGVASERDPAKRLEVSFYVLTWLLQYYVCY